MQFNIITIFPHIFDSYFNESIISRAQKKGLVKINIHNLRDYTEDKHHKVDDTPYGGGVGMVMKAEPIAKAIESIKSKVHKVHSAQGGCVPMNFDGGAKVKNSKIQIPKSKFKVVLLSARGKKWDQQMAKKYSKLKNIILICGRYEGVDERVKKFIDEEVSVGDYVLTGGELPAAILVDSVTRLLPGVLGKDESSVDESHSEKGVLEYPHYTRPANIIFKTRKKGKIINKNLSVPEVLLSGDHKKIGEWRTTHKSTKTQKHSSVAAD